MANIIELPEVSKTLEILKPAEVRLKSWGNALTPIFNWEQEKLLEIKNSLEKYNALMQIPLKKESIPLLAEIEDAIKEAGKLKRSCDKERKDLTKPIDSVKERLMLIEKSYLKIEESLKGHFLLLKKIENEEKRKVEERNNLIFNFKTKVSSYYINQMAMQRKYIAELCNKVHLEALDTKTEDDIPFLIMEILNIHKQQNGLMCLEYKIEPAYAEDKELLDIAESLKSNYDRPKLLLELEDSLNDTFSDFQQELTNKIEAKNAADAALLLKKEEINEKEEEENTEVFFAAKSEELEAPKTGSAGGNFSFSSTKEIKKYFVIEMNHDKASLINIDKAFHSVLDKCLAIYRGDYWTLDYQKKCDLLCKLKNEDKTTSFFGINFIEKDKI